MLAAERAILRIACVVRNFSDGVPEGTVLVAEQRVVLLLIHVITTVKL